MGEGGRGDDRSEHLSPSAVVGPPVADIRCVLPLNGGFLSRAVTLSLEESQAAGWGEHHRTLSYHPSSSLRLLQRQGHRSAEEASIQRQHTADVRNRRPHDCRR
ncbi:unnamed protein product [Arctogadus glacialis]